MHSPRPATVSAVRAGVRSAWKDGRIPGPVSRRELAARSGLADRTVQRALDSGVLANMGITRTPPGGKRLARMSEPYVWAVTSHELFDQVLSERPVADPSMGYWQDCGQSLRAVWVVLLAGGGATAAIAARAGVSRRTADRALVRLADDGAVVRGRRRGTWDVVAGWTPDTVRVVHVTGTVRTPDGGRRQVTGTRQVVRQAVRAGERTARDTAVARILSKQHEPTDEQVAELGARGPLGVEGLTPEMVSASKALFAAEVAAVAAVRESAVQDAPAAVCF